MLATLPSLIPEAFVLLVLLSGTDAYLRWPLRAIYVLVSWRLIAKVRANIWIVTIVRDASTRITHGLEHATLAVLHEHGLPVIHGFTHARDRFMIALKGGHGHQLAAARGAAASAIHRILTGERALAYHPGCGTSEAVFAVSMWLVFVTSMVLSRALGGSTGISLAICVITFRIWDACETGLGLLAQRWFTVSTAFSSASIVDVRQVSRLPGFVCPPAETWFEVVVDIQSATTEAGLVSPGALG